MKYLIVIIGLLTPVMGIPAQDEAARQNLPRQGLPRRQALFTWDLLWTGSWEESKTLHNRGDLRIGFVQPGLQLRTQVLDRRPLNFTLDPPWTDPAKAISGAAAGLYHRESGSRLLYGILDEWGLPARIRSPWIRSAPYTENHKPIMADLRTTVSSTKEPEAYAYLSSPRLSLFDGIVRPRAFVSAQTPTATIADGGFSPSFSGGLDTMVGKDIELLLEGFYTSAELPARASSTWFSDPPPLPARDFRLGAMALMLNAPYYSVTSDWAWSQTFAWGSGIYGNAGIRLSPPLPWNTAAKPGPWSLSLAADGMTERYVGRDGTSPGGGLRSAGKIEWKGPRSSLFRMHTTLRGPGIDQAFERSASGIYYRFPARSAKNNEGFPLRISRFSLSADRNASDLNKIRDGIDGTLGLSLSLPPISLPTVLLTASARRVKTIKPQSYPLSINFSASIDELGSAIAPVSPYPFFPAHQEFDSAKTSGELLWSPGIFQFRTKWGYTVYAEKDNRWEGSVSTAVRFKYGRFSTKIAWPEFPEKWNCTLSWRLER